MYVTKFFHLLLAVSFLVLFGQEAKSAGPNVDSMFTLLSGEWYLNGNCNGLSGACEAVYSQDLYVIERIPATDSLTLKKYEDGQLTHTLKYLLFYGHSSLHNKDQWMIQTCSPCFKSSIFVNSTRLELALDAPDGGGQIYGRLFLTDLKNQTNKAKELIFFPNPCKDVLNVEVPVSSGQLTIFDLHGKEVKTVNISKGSLAPLDITEMPSGVYSIRIMSEGEVFVGRIYKQ